MASGRGGAADRARLTGRVPVRRDAGRMSVSPLARTGIEPIPAIDLSRGRVVRLFRGVRERETVYGEDPLRIAAEFAAAGARWLHVVDLDAAFGDGGHGEAVRRLLSDSGLRVQVAGGVRSVGAYRRLRDAGARRVVFGTAALETPEVVEEAIRRDPAGVVVALDVRGGRLRGRGWVEAAAGQSGEAAAGRRGEAAAMSPETAARLWGGRGAAAIVHTRIERDGTMEGPDPQGALRVARASGVPTIVAGGVGDLSHLRELRAAAAPGSGGRGGAVGLAGVILGRALYERRFTLREARAALAAPAPSEAVAGTGGGETRG